MEDEWLDLEQLKSREYTCGYCGNNIASNEGYVFDNAVRRDKPKQCIYICHKCKCPTFFDYAGKQSPSSKYGDNVSYLPDEVMNVYDEARNCFSVGAYTSVVLGCRKLLMNISCTLGANEGQKFVQYVDFLDTKGFIPPNGKGWVSEIKNLGNNGTHKLESRSKEDAILAIQFTSMLLKFIYEFPNKLKINKIK